MWRIILVATVAALGIGGWYASANYSLEVHRSAEGKFQYVRIVPRTASGSVPSEGAADQPPAAPTRPAIRVATFNLDGLDDNRLANPKVCDSLVRILSRFDVVALQHIHSGNRGVLMRLKDQINATGRCYDFVTCPTLDRDPVEIYNAMLFDATTVEVDHSTVHSVDAPPGTFHVRPLVAEFRVRGPPPSEAFTFMLVNVLVDPRRGPQELDSLADVFRAARAGTAATARTTSSCSATSSPIRSISAGWAACRGWWPPSTEFPRRRGERDWPTTSSSTAARRSSTPAAPACWT